MSRARGLWGRGGSTLLPIKHTIVWSLPDPLLNPGTRLHVILTAVCRHLHTPGVLAAPACDKHTRIHHRCQLGVQTHTHTHSWAKFTIKITWKTMYTWLRGSDRPNQAFCNIINHWYPMPSGIRFHKSPQRLQLYDYILHSLTAANGWLH